MVVKYFTVCSSAFSLVSQCSCNLVNEILQLLLETKKAVDS